MTEQEGRRRRRRGRRGGGPRPDGAAPQPEGRDEPSAPPPAGGGPRQRVDRRAGRGRPVGPPPGPPDRTPATGGRTHRSPASGERPQREPERDRRPQRRDRDRDGGTRDRGPRVFEPPTPPDERSVELSARFREAQNTMRDARKAIDRRKAEFGDEPQWLLDQYAEAERAFGEIATEWSEHLATTGRKMARAERR